MKPDEMQQEITALLTAGWTSGGMTIEQKSTDAPEEYWWVKYFHDKDDAEMGGHWNLT
jgi:hypothetical protein